MHTCSPGSQLNPEECSHQLYPGLDQKKKPAGKGRWFFPATSLSWDSDWSSASRSGALITRNMWTCWKRPESNPTWLRTSKWFGALFHTARENSLSHSPGKINLMFPHRKMILKSYSLNIKGLGPETTCHQNIFKSMSQSYFNIAKKYWDVWYFKVVYGSYLFLWKA